jgi:hypothetical protein
MLDNKQMWWSFCIPSGILYTVNAYDIFVVKKYGSIIKLTEELKVPRSGGTTIFPVVPLSLFVSLGVRM